MTATRDGVAWWIVEQTAWCSFCWQGYPGELHVTCVVCDGPVCPMCTTQDVARGGRCPECAAEAAPPASEPERAPEEAPS